MSDLSLLVNYDLISICETSLNDSVKLPDTLLNDYTFEPANHPANTRRGGVGLFFKNSLPVVIQKDLSFDESIVVELKFGRKKVFFTVLYRSPSFDHTSPEFQAFLLNFRNLYSKIQAGNPFLIILTFTPKLFLNRIINPPDSRPFFTPMCFCDFTYSMK